MVHSYNIHHKTCNRSCIKSSVKPDQTIIAHPIKYRILRHENVIKLPDTEGREAVTATARRCILHALIVYGRRVKRRTQIIFWVLNIKYHINSRGPQENEILGQA